MEELQEVIEQINDENSILTYENKLKEQKIQLDTQNHLYNKIASNVSCQLKALKQCLNDTHDLRKACIYGAYIKRYANLQLIAENEQVMSLSQLYFAIRESLDYYVLTDRKADIRFEHDAEFASSSIIAAYEFFETFLERADGSFMVNIDGSSDALLKIMTDGLDTFDTKVVEKQLKDNHLSLYMEWENDVCFLSLKQEENRDES